MSEPVGTNEPLRCCCACALGFEAVPTPHLTLAGDEALANGKGLVLVGLDNGDLFEPTHQFGWRADMIREAFRTGGQGRIARPGFASGPTPRAIAITDRGIGIFAEGRCERSLVTGLRREARDDRSAAMLKGGCKRAMFGPGSRERRSRRRELRLAKSRCSAASARPSSASTRFASARASAIVADAAFASASPFARTWSWPSPKAPS